MKKRTNILTLAAMVSVLTLGLISCEENDVASETFTSGLSAVEKSSLLFMREEEKVARDVYDALYDKWQVASFANISDSEQQHMDAVLGLINKYNLTDPVGANGPGVFTNARLQELYDELVGLGSLSVMEALKVGATIEDLDIYDLADALTQVDNADIRLVFSNLSKGSRNHLRSFYSSILLLGGNYTPQYITQDEFDSIVNSAIEKGW